MQIIQPTDLIKEASPGLVDKSPNEIGSQNSTGQVTILHTVTGQLKTANLYNGIQTDPLLQLNHCIKKLYLYGVWSSPSGTFSAVQLLS